METPPTEPNYDALGPEVMTEITDVVFDGDNTIWDWVTYAAHGYDAMAQCIADESKRPEPEVAAAMKQFYTIAGTMEHRGLIQGLEAAGFFKSVPNFNRNELVDKVQNAFTEARRKYLHIYKGMEQVIQTLHECGKRISIITDAPKFQATMRVRYFKLDPFIKGVYAMADSDIQDLPEKFQKRQEAGLYDVDFPTFVTPVEKPDSDLETILQMTLDQIARQVLIIGDNPKKDIALAERYGCRAIYAVYGMPEKKYLDRLLRLSPEKVARKNTAISEEPTTTSTNNRVVPANEPYDILRYLRIATA
ncbi:MAG: HAD hydrolase-like protein [Candidatus Gracilibacteria bacterium]|jgi:FMN phosphatase YigB (HAD superfamily)